MCCFPSSHCWHSTVPESRQSNVSAWQEYVQQSRRENGRAYEPIVQLEGKEREIVALKVAGWDAGEIMGQTCTRPAPSSRGQARAHSLSKSGTCSILEVRHVHAACFSARTRSKGFDSNSLSSQVKSSQVKPCQVSRSKGFDSNSRAAAPPGGHGVGRPTKGRARERGVREGSSIRDQILQVRSECGGSRAHRTGELLAFKK